MDPEDRYIQEGKIEVLLYTKGNTTNIAELSNFFT
jgi:hypothetical protein